MTHANMISTCIYSCIIIIIYSFILGWTELYYHIHVVGDVHTYLLHYCISIRYGGCIFFISISQYLNDRDNSHNKTHQDPLENDHPRTSRAFDPFCNMVNLYASQEETHTIPICVRGIYIMNHIHRNRNRSQ